MTNQQMITEGTNTSLGVRMTSEGGITSLQRSIDVTISSSGGEFEYCMQYVYVHL